MEPLKALVELCILSMAFVFRAGALLFLPRHGTPRLLYCLHVSAPIHVIHRHGRNINLSISKMTTTLRSGCWMLAAHSRQIITYAV